MLRRWRFTAVSDLVKSAGAKAIIGRADGSRAAALTMRLDLLSRP